MIISKFLMNVSQILIISFQFFDRRCTTTVILLHHFDAGKLLMSVSRAIRYLLQKMTTMMYLSIVSLNKKGREK